MPILLASEGAGFSFEGRDAIAIPTSGCNFLRLSGFMGQSRSNFFQLLSGRRKIFSAAAQWNIRRVSLLSTRNVTRS